MKKLLGLQCTHCAKNGIQEYDSDGFTTCIYCGHSSYINVKFLNIFDERRIQTYGICYRCGLELWPDSDVGTLYMGQVFIGYICADDCEEIEDKIFEEV